MNDINNESWHDIDVNHLHFNFSHQTIELSFAQNDCNNISNLCFYEVSAVEIRGFDGFTKFDDLELYNADFFIENDMKKVEFTFLLSFSEPDWRLRFFYKDVEVTLF